MKDTILIKKVKDVIVNKLQTLEKDVKFAAEVDDKIKEAWLAGHKSALIGVYVLVDEEEYEIKR